MKLIDRINKAMTELNQSEHPKCYCGNPIQFNPKSKETPFGGWRKYCSRLCMQRSPDTNEKRKATMLERYGVEHKVSTKRINRSIFMFLTNNSCLPCY